MFYFTIIINYWIALISQENVFLLNPVYRRVLRKRKSNFLQVDKKIILFKPKNKNCLGYSQPLINSELIKVQRCTLESPPYLFTEYFTDKQLEYFSKSFAKLNLLISR